MTTNGDGRKLVIGTQSFNALVTSCARFDETRITVGPTASSFILNDARASLAIRIFVDVEAEEKSIELAKDPNTRCLEEYNMLYQLRQIRSKFSHPSSYFLCRASSAFARTHTCQPYTIFTYADYDDGKDCAARIASKLFRHIGLSMIKSGQPTLDKAMVQKCHNNYPPGKVRDVLGSILELYEGNEATLSVLRNKSLDIQLQKLADLLSSSISSANKNVAEAIKARFNTFPWIPQKTHLAHPILSETWACTLLCR